MITGTCHFYCRLSAESYYRDLYPQGTVRDVVSRKIASGEIRIGKPDLKPGQSAFLGDGNTRWFIQEAAK